MERLSCLCFRYPQDHEISNFDQIDSNINQYKQKTYVWQLCFLKSSLVLVIIWKLSKNFIFNLKNSKLLNFIISDIFLIDRVKIKLEQSTKGDSDIVAYRKNNQREASTIKTGYHAFELLSSKREFLKVNHDKNRISLKDRARLLIIKSPFRHGDMDGAEMEVEDSVTIPLLKNRIEKKSDLDHEPSEKVQSLTKTNHLASNSFQHNLSNPYSCSNNFNISNRLHVVHENSGNLEEIKQESISRNSSWKINKLSESYCPDFNSLLINEAKKHARRNKTVDRVRKYLLSQLK